MRMCTDRTLTHEHSFFMGLGMMEWLKWRSRLAMPAEKTRKTAAEPRDELIVLLTNMMEVSPLNGN